MNLGLGAWWLTREIRLKAEASGAVMNRSEAAKALKTGGAADDAAAGAGEMGVTPLAAAVKRRDLPAIRDLLRASGLPESLVFYVARRLSNEWSENAFYERYPAYAPKKGTWWTSETGDYMAIEMDGEASKANWAFMLGGITRLTELFPFRQRDDDWTVSTDLRFLTAERRADLRAMRFDYLLMRFEMQNEAGSFLLPSDAKALRLIEDEFRTEREAFLTPEERMRYELDTTSSGRSLRTEWGKAGGTLDELRELMPLVSEYERRFGNSSWYAQPLAEEKAAYEAEKSAARKALEDAKKAVLGEERYRLAKLQPDADLVVLEEAAKRFALPKETVDTVYASAAQVAAESQRLAADPAMDDAGRRTALAELARETRREVTALLGEEVAEAYLSQRMGWLKDVEGGAVLELDENGRAKVRKQDATPPATEGGNL